MKPSPAKTPRLIQHLRKLTPAQMEQALTPEAKQRAFESLLTAEQLVSAKRAKTFRYPAAGDWDTLNEKVADLQCESRREELLAGLIDVAAVAMDWADAILRRTAAGKKA